MIMNDHVLVQTESNVTAILSMSDIAEAYSQHGFIVSQCETTYILTSMYWQVLEDTKSIIIFF